ncbi:Ig-like domain-containing protein [Deinococcus pimensis]|uniref:Ig-like domain-containing protein n=1 Tax=Deinococcus pimensis TaxID=309888 RepID=UPI0004BBD890|nr:Ig-like domain-containing protein [Deinococcus pimensis]
MRRTLVPVTSALTLALILSACGGPAAPAAPSIGALSTAALEFTATSGQAAAAQSFTFTNGGGSDLAYAASVAYTEGQDWLAVTPAAATVAAGATQTVDVTATCPVVTTSTVLHANATVASSTDATITASVPVTLTCTVTTNGGGGGDPTPTPDKTAPVVTVGTGGPASGWYGDSTVSVNASTTDNVGVTSVSWTLTQTSGGTLTDADVATPDPTTGAFAIALDSLTNGAYDLAVTATDAAGNTGTQTYSFKVDVDDPTLTVAAPTLVSGGGFTVSGTATDSGGSAIDAASGVTYVVKAADDTVVGSGAAALTNGAYSVTVNGLADGTYTVTVSVADGAGNSVTAQPVSVTTSALKPSVSLAAIAPSNGNFTVSGTVLTPAVTPVTALAYTITPKGGSEGAPVTVPLSKISGTGAFSFGATATTDGSYTINVKVSNLNGTSVASTAFVIDKVLPTVTFKSVSVVAKNGNRKTTTVSLNVADATSGVGTVSYATSANGTYTVAKPVTGSTDPLSRDYLVKVTAKGTYGVYVKACDLAGNCTAPTLATVQP